VRLARHRNYVYMMLDGTLGQDVDGGRTCVGRRTAPCGAASGLMPVTLDADPPGLL